MSEESNVDTSNLESDAANAGAANAGAANSGAANAGAANAANFGAANGMMGGILEPIVSPEMEQKAKDFINKVGANETDREGLQSLQNLTLSMGLPAARASFKFMLDAAPSTSPQRDKVIKKEALKEIEDFSPITEVGCMQIDFFNNETRRPDRAYLLLDECSRDHNLTAELIKLRRVVDEDKWLEVVKHMSMLVHLGRSVYSQVASQHKPLIRRIFNRPADHDCADMLQLGVDSRNTTLFVDPKWPRRIGIFMKMESEISGKP